MIGWLIFAAYTVGFLFCTRSYALRYLNSDPVPRGLTDGDKAFALFVGACCGACWPLFVPIYEVFRVIIRSGVLTTDYEREQAVKARAAADRAELMRLRAQARAHNLPYPEVPDGK